MSVTMHILMLVPHPNIQGPIAKIVSHLIATLNTLGCEIVTEPWGRHNDHESLADKVIGRAQDIIRIRNTLAHQRFDMMLVETAHDWATLARDIPLLLATRSTVSTIILQLHGSQPEMLIGDGHWVFKRLSAWQLRMSNAYLLLSTDEVNKWCQFYPDGKYYLVFNPYTSPEDLSIMRLPAMESIPEVPIILFVGRVITAKGIFELVDALILVLKEMRCHLIIAGDGEQMSELRAKIEQVKLREHVSLLGFKDSSSLKRIYSEASIFVLPTWSEGFPTVIVEAMDAGLPIVTTYIRGAADHLVPEVNALFIPPHDPASLAAALLRLLKDPELCEKMGAANREKVKDFSPENAGKLYLEVLVDVLKRTPALG